MEKREVRIGIAVILFMLFLAYAGYLTGRREANKSTEDVRLRMKIDTLEHVLDLAASKNILLSDSLKKNDQARIDRIEIIDAVKKTIQNEIKKSTQSVYVVPDSLHQRFVDSIRAGKGFNQIQY